MGTDDWKLRGQMLWYFPSSSESKRPEIEQLTATTYDYNGDVMVGVPVAYRAFSGHHGGMPVDYSLMEGYALKEGDIKYLYHIVPTEDKKGRKKDVRALVNSFVQHGIRPGFRDQPGDARQSAFFSVGDYITTTKWHNLRPELEKKRRLVPPNTVRA